MPLPVIIVPGYDLPHRPRTWYYTTGHQVYLWAIQNILLLVWVFSTLYNSLNIYDVQSHTSQLKLKQLVLLRLPTSNRTANLMTGVSLDTWIRNIFLSLFLAGVMQGITINTDIIQCLQNRTIN